MSLTGPNKQITTEDTDLSKFNHNMSLLFVQLSKAYPDDRDLKVYHDKFEWSKRFNARAACDYFIKYVSPYVKEIMLKEESCFFSLNYDQYTENEQYLNTIRKIIEIWQSSDNDQLKNNIWRFFQILLTYGIKVAKRRDLAEILNRYRKKPLVI